MSGPTTAPQDDHWSQIPSVLEAGRHFLQGNEACAEGAIAAGCNYYAGYPVTPAGEILEHLCNRFAGLPGRVFVQMEDEIASIASVIGASWAGARAMTATSGPGISLMLENIGYAILTETPCVIVDVQRAGPSTGQATRPAQGDVMQVRWGAHGDYEIIAIAPWSVQEVYQETIRAFNLADQFRVPVFLLLDEALGHLRETVRVPASTPVYQRYVDLTTPPFGHAEVPSMPAFGQGARLLVTGSTHDEWGYRRASSPEAQETTVQRLCDKILNHRQEIVTSDAYAADGELDVLVIAYGFTARSATAAVKQAREKGIRAGLLRPITLWPFAEEVVHRVSEKARQVLVVEMNRGQLLREVQRVVPQAVGYGKTNGQVITPAEILKALQTVVHI